MPNCGYCKDCKWWDGNDVRVVDGPFKADCNNARVVEMFGHDYWAPTTPSDFGCLQFEARE